MNIKRIDNFFNVRPSTSKKINQGVSFEKIMNQTVSDIQAQDATQPIGQENVALKHSDKVLTLLDQYALKLGDRSVTLKEIDPIVSRIEKEVSLMKANAAKGNSEADDIDQFLEDVAVTANVAILKFQRGDYIP